MSIKTVSVSCKACQFPGIAALDKQVWAGEIVAADAAKRVGLDYEEYWVHLKQHNTSCSSTWDPSNLSSMLRYCTENLKKRVDTLMAIPVNQNSPSTEKSIGNQLRLLKDLVMDIAKLEHQIEASPQVQINQIFMQQQSLTTVILSEVCPECKNKILKSLEKAQ